MQYLKKNKLALMDLLFLPFVYPAAWLLKKIRMIGVANLPHCKEALFKIGVFPIRNHYYEPQFDNNNPNPDFFEDRELPGIDWNISGQLEMLKSFAYTHELADVPLEKTSNLQFFMNNGAFEEGCAEFWYQLIRTVKPKRIIEIGSGNSTLMARNAIKMNIQENRDYACEHTCIEPYEMPWLEQSGVSVIRKKVEEVSLSFFSQLNENDILFIDSSHIIRPQGDVVFEYLQLLPSLNKGVIVHIHDIFSPKNYPQAWLTREILFWNEQYLLEAFLSHNASWQIIGALNYLQHHHYEAFKTTAPFLKPESDPGSFYIKKIA